MDILDKSLFARPNLQNLEVCQLFYTSTNYGMRGMYKNLILSFLAINSSWDSVTLFSPYSAKRQDEGGEMDMSERRHDQIGNKAG